MESLVTGIGSGAGAKSARAHDLEGGAKAPPSFLFSFTIGAGPQGRRAQGLLLIPDRRAAGPQGSRVLFICFSFVFHV